MTTREQQMATALRRCERLLPLTVIHLGAGTGKSQIFDSTGAVRAIVHDCPPLADAIVEALSPSVSPAGTVEVPLHVVEAAAIAMDGYIEATKRLAELSGGKGELPPECQSFVEVRDQLRALLAGKEKG